MCATACAPVLLTGRCYEAEIYTILLPLRCAFAWYHFLPKSKLSVSGLKTMDYNLCVLTILGSLFEVILLPSGRCYGAEICAILLLLRCSFRWYPFLAKSKFSDFGQKPWTIIRRFDQNRGHSLRSFYSSLEGATELKFVPFCSS